MSLNRRPTNPFWFPSAPVCFRQPRKLAYQVERTKVTGKWPTFPVFITAHLAWSKLTSKPVRVLSSQKTTVKFYVVHGPITISSWCRSSQKRDTKLVQITAVCVCWYGGAACKLSCQKVMNDPHYLLTPVQRRNHSLCHEQRKPWSHLPKAPWTNGALNP